MDFLNRKLILCGNEKIKNDIKYLFQELSFEQIDINDEVDWSKDDKESFFIIVCESSRKKKMEDFFQRFELVYGKNYIYSKDFFAYYNPMFLKRRNRKLAVWGTGEAAAELWQILDDRGFSTEIEFYIDNANEKKYFMGRPVILPAELKGNDEVFIIVASRLYHWEIYQQLKQYGFLAGTDFVHFSEVNKDYSLMLEKVCFVESKYAFRCPRPFGYCDVIEGDLYACCPDYLPVSLGNMNSNTFWECWDSYIARILRLSVTNGTFAFCNKAYCDVFDFDIDLQGNDKEPLNENTIIEDKHNLEMLMVGIDYSCNLRCPSCRDKICVADVEERKNIDRWAEDLLENVIPYAKRLWLAGCGETFFSPTYKKMLNDERCKKRKTINILSNGMLFDETAWKMLEGYQEIEVAISMDGIKNETIEMLRRGGNADKLKKNLKMLGELRKNNKIKELCISCVLQAANVDELYDLLEWCKEIGIDRVSFLRIKDNGIYTKNQELFDKASLFDENDCLKENYKAYFTNDLLYHPLADWTNNAKSIGIETGEVDPFRW